MALFILAGLQVIPSELYEAASVDGSTRLQQFWQITDANAQRSAFDCTYSSARLMLFACLICYISLEETQCSPSHHTQISKMFAGSTADFGPGVASAVIVFLMGIVISLVFVAMMRQRGKAVKHQE